MKKTILAALMLTSMSLAANAQEQLANAGFEEWENVSYKKTGFGAKTFNGEEPLNWSSFLDGTGGLKGTAITDVQLYKDTDKRPGSTGMYSARIEARSILAIAIAQGNLTNGCVNMGSMDAKDANGNYNYINHDRADQAMSFTGKPGSFKVWLKGSCSNKASVAIYLVNGKGYYQDPVSSKKPNTATLVAEAKIQTDVTNSWQEYMGEFTYKSDLLPEYVLVNISTSATPGEGNKNDVLYIDDIVMDYTSSVDAIEIAETDVPTAMFNLAGQRISDTTKGIVIKNGKKYVVR